MRFFVRGIKALFVLVIWAIYEVLTALSGVTERVLRELIEEEESDDEDWID